MSTSESPLPTLRDALEAVRREALKAALVYAVVDAAVTATVVTILLSTVSVGVVPETVTVPLPAALAGTLQPLTGTTGAGLVVSGPAAVGIVVGLVSVPAELLYVRRRDPVRWFERANPELGEALRTARDAAEDDAENVMAAALYREVLDRLRTASGVALLNRTGLAARLAIAMVVVLAAGGITALGVSVDLPDLRGDRAGGSDGGRGEGDAGGDAGGDGATGGEDAGGLRPGEDVLGDPTEVPRGEIAEEVVVDPGGGSAGADRPYETSGFPAGEVAVEAESAGFAPPEAIDDADLVREYSIAIRTNESGGGDGG